MDALALVDAAASPADLVRRRLLRAFGPIAGKLAADRETRVGVMGVSVVLFALLGAVTLPLWVLALGPVLLGVPHLVADIRYLWIRPGLHLRPAAWLFIGGPMLAGLVTGRLVAGLFAAAGAVMIARTSLRRRLLALTVVAALAYVAEIAGALADVIFAHAHNLIAVGLWWAWRPRRGRAHTIPLVLFALASVALVAGLADALPVQGASLGPSLRYHASVLAPGLDATWSTRLVLFFCFAQSVHYGVWLRLVPEEDRERETPRTFRASARKLIEEMGLWPFAVALFACVGIVVWAVFDLGMARHGYLRFAVFHGQLELAAVALFAVQGSARVARSAPPA